MSAAARPFRPAESGPPRMVPQRHVVCADAVPTDPVLAAEAEAAAILIAAQDERERMRSEGYAEGQARAAAEREAMHQAVARAVAELDAARDEAIAVVARNAAELAVELAVEWTASAVAQDPAVVAPLVARALREAPVGSTVIRVAPEAAPHVGETGLRVMPDPSLGPGDVVIESPGGELDAHLCVMREMLIGAVRGAG